MPQDGAGDRSRTYDLRITNALLYQLSYTGHAPRDRRRILIHGSADARASDGPRRRHALQAIQHQIGRQGSRLGQAGM